MPITMADGRNPTRGDDFSVDIIVYARAAMPGEEQTAVPRRNISDDDFTLTCKRRRGDTTAAITKVSSDSDQITITDGAEGELTAYFKHADSAGFPAKDTTVFCDLEGIDSAGRRYTAVKDTMIFECDETD